MKLNKKKELYVNAIIGGKRATVSQCKSMVKAGIMVGIGEIEAIYTWDLDILKAQTFKHLRELYTVLNG
jgi:hypothetical protein